MDIKKILKKRRWTGKEVGQVLIASFMNDIKNPGTALFPQETFDRMVTSLHTEKDFQEYDVYKSLYYAVIDSHSTGAGLMQQQFAHGSSRLLGELREVRLIEEAMKALAKYKIEPNPLRNFDSLDSIAGDERKRREPRKWKETHIDPAMKYLYAHNALMGIIGKAYDVEILGEGAIISTALYEETVGTYNKALSLFQEEAKTKKKRDLIKDIFPTLDDPSELKPTPEAIYSLTAEINGYGVTPYATRKLRFLWHLISRLQPPPKGKG